MDMLLIYGKNLKSSAVASNYMAFINLAQSAKDLGHLHGHSG